MGMQNQISNQCCESDEFPSEIVKIDDDNSLAAGTLVTTTLPYTIAFSSCQIATTKLEPIVIVQKTFLNNYMRAYCCVWVHVNAAIESVSNPTLAFSRRCIEMY